MSSYAYVDIAKTETVLAEDCTAQDCIKDFYCPTLKCPAVMHLTAFGSDKRVAHFGEKNQGSHCKDCNLPPNDFDPTQYTDDGFNADDFIDGLCISGTQKSEPHNHATGDGHIRHPKSLLKLYYLLKSSSPDQIFAGQRISSLLIDGRLRYFYPDRLEGNRIIECNFHRYSDPEQAFYMFDCVRHWESIKIVCHEKKLFEAVKAKMFSRNGVVDINKLHQINFVMAGKWYCESINKNQHIYHYLTTDMHNLKQIVVPSSQL